tara:strand:- start:4145 stop:4477 length:333 start_codon:yes stop_codon:yes gene_type:complete
MANAQINITNESATNLLAKDATKSTAVIKSVLIANADASDVNVNLYIEKADGTIHYIVKGVLVKATTTFYYDSPIEYNAEIFDLKVLADEVGGSSPSVSAFLTYTINNKI